MTEYKIEEYGKFSNLPYAIIQLTWGKQHRCAYVGIPDSHPLFNIDYNEEIPNATRAQHQQMLTNPIDDIGVINALCSNGEDVTPVLLFRVHGGLTFSRGTWPGMPFAYPIQVGEPIWWYGFDSAHYGDTEPHGQSLSYMRSNCRKLAQQLRDYFNRAQADRDEAKDRLFTAIKTMKRQNYQPMITKFNQKDKTTWPPDQKPVLIRYKSLSRSFEITVAFADWNYPEDPYVFWDVVGTTGSDLENIFRTEDVCAWQPIPSWGGLDQ